jgi:hypothetical protein
LINSDNSIVIQRFLSLIPVRPQKLPEVAELVRRNWFRARRLLVLPVRFSDLEREFAVAFAQLAKLTAPVDLPHVAHRLV